MWRWSAGRPCVRTDGGAQAEERHLHVHLEDVRERKVRQVAVGRVELEAGRVRDADRDRELGDAHALGVARRTGRVHDDGEVVGARRGRLDEVLGAALQQRFEAEEGDAGGLARRLHLGGRGVARGRRHERVLGRRGRLHLGEHDERLEGWALAEHLGHLMQLGFLHEKDRDLGVVDLVLYNVLAERVVDRNARVAARHHACPSEGR